MKDVRALLSRMSSWRVHPIECLVSLLFVPAIGLNARVKGTFGADLSKSESLSSVTFAVPIETIRVTDAAAIFEGETANPANAEPIPADHGARIATLQTGALSGEEGYVGLIRFNVEVWVEALGS